MVYCNTTLSDEKIVEDPLWKNGLIFHHVGLIVSAVFGLVSVFVALFLVYRHATHYSKPWEQKHIIRILLMIPIYSTVSFLSYLYYRHAIYFEVLRDCYEAFAIASFFTLLCNYIAPNLHDQKEYFRTLTPKNWFWGVFGLQKCTGGQNKGMLRKPRSGLTWFNVIWLGVFQYCFIRVIFTIVSVVTQATGRYCESSKSPAFAHVWVMVFEGGSVTIAMFCLVQFYIQLKTELAEHRPFLKVLCIKLVIFFSFWQSFIIDALDSSSGPLQPTKTLAYPDISVGIPSMLLCIEMAMFSVLHLFAFPWKGYDISNFSDDPLAAPGTGFSGQKPRNQGGRLGWKAVADALNPWDIAKASARGFRWLFVGRKKRFEDASYTGTTTKPGQGSFASGGLTPTPYQAPSFAGAGDIPTELRPSADNGRGRADTHATDSDTAGLLAHAGTSPRRDKYDQDTAYNSSGDIGYGAPHHNVQSPPMPSDFGGFDHVAERMDTSYHGASMHQPPQQQQPQAPIGAAYGGQPGEWDMWAGAHRPDAPHDPDQQSTRPPTYQTTNV